MQETITQSNRDLKDSVATDVHTNDFYTFLSVKIEKLVTAVYMVTNFLSDKEPVKWRLRDISLSMLSHATVLNEKSFSERSIIVSSILSSIGETLSLLEIAHLSGFISEMNYSVLKREFATIADALKKQDEVKKSVHNVSLSKTFFNETNLPVFVPTQERLTTHNSMSSDKTTPAHMPQTDVQKNSVHTYETKNNIKDMSEIGGYRNHVPYSQKNYRTETTDARSRDVSEKPLAGKVEKAKHERQESIVQILKDKSDLTIKDIASEIVGCSEKTIQRELISLLKTGVIRKRGERRWSRYSLNTELITCNL